MKKQKGFTLIELIVVIVVLGILAVFAAPKYLSFTKDAARSTVEGVGGSIESAMELSYSKAVIAGVENNATSQVGGQFLVYGYPESASVTNVLKLDSRFSAIALELGQMTIAAPGYEPTTVDSEACQVTYAESTSEGERPVITYQLSGCDKDVDFSTMT